MSRTFLDLMRRGVPWFVLGIAASSAVMLVDLSRLLGDVESVGQRSYTARVFTDFRPFFWITAELAEAMELWGKAAFDAKPLISWHLGVDTFGFVPAYATLIWASLKHLSDVPAFPRMTLVALLGSDWAENAATYYVVVRRDFETDHAWLLLVQSLSFLKWVCIGAALVTVLVLWLRPTSNGENRLDRVLDAVRKARRSKEPHPGTALFGLIVLVALFASFVALPAGGPLEQLPDVLRYSLSGDAHRSVLVLSTLALLLLAGALVAGGLAATVRTDAVTPGTTLNRAIVVGIGCAAALSLLLFAVGWLVNGYPSPVPFSYLLVVGSLSAAAWLGEKADVTARSDAGGSAVPEKSSAAHESAARLLWVGALAGLIVVAGGLGLIRAAFPPMVLGLRDPLWWRIATLGGILTALLGGALTQLAVAWWKPHTEHGRAGWRQLRRPAAIGGLIIPVAAWLSIAPHHGAWWGTPGVIAIGFAFLAIAIGLLHGVSRLYPPWAVTYALGFKRGTPWLAMLVATWVVASVLNTKGVYHDVRVDSDSIPYHHHYSNLDSAFQTWIRARSDQCPAGGPVPMVLVAAPGGGIRAAYWTAATLDRLFDPRQGKCASLALFAVSGVSGGSVGATTWATATAAGRTGKSLVARLSQDRALAAAAAGLLLRDLLQPFTGLTRAWRDRAALVEDGWIQSDTVYGPAAGPLSWAEVGNGLDWRPLLVLNASSVTDGCRVLLANVGRLQAAAGRDCAASPLGSQRAGPVSASIDPFPSLYRRARDGSVACGSPRAGLSAVSAALLSARFPGVSPSGALLRCVSDAQASDTLTTYTVDGGYYENSGLLTLLQIWSAVDTMVRRHNSMQTNDSRIVPWIVVVDNHYRSSARTAPSRRPAELTIPVRASSNEETFGQAALEQAAAFAVGAERRHCVARDERTTGGCLLVIAPTKKPSVAAPLGWVLSPTTRQDLDDQLEAKFAPTEPSQDSVLAELLRQLASR